MKCVLMLASLMASSGALAATLNVSGKSALEAALNQARGGDVIVLAAGSYGELNLRNKSYSSKVTIRSKSVSSPARFSAVLLSNVDNMSVQDLSIQGTGETTVLSATSSSRIEFANLLVVGKTKNGYGIGKGAGITNSSGVTLRDSTIRDFARGVGIFNSEGVSIINNDILDSSHDGMQINKTSDLLIDGNTLTKNAAPGLKHSDLIQMYNEGSSAPSSDVQISNNILTADDIISHGIYLNNEEYRRSRSSKQIFRNFVIQNNTVRTGQMSAIALGATVGLTIRNNKVLNYFGSASSKIRTPAIAVDRYSSNVSVTGNKTYRVFASTDNWQEVATPKAWNISNNTKP